MTSEQYHQALEECLSKIWQAQLALETAIDAVTECHVAIRAAQSPDKLNAKLLRRPEP